MPTPSSVEERLAIRSEWRLEKYFRPLSALNSNSIQALILTAASDLGTELNGGRIGARFAPAALLSSLGKLAIDKASSLSPIITTSVFSTEQTLQESEKDLLMQKSQLASQKEIAQILNQFSHLSRTFPVIHLGGGHDHIFCLLMALKDLGYEHIKILNIDAHADTRNDEWAHSGNPFRMAAQHIKISLFQYGLHSYANTLSTLAALPTPSVMHAHTYPEVRTLSNNFTQLPLPLLQNLLANESAKKEKVAYVFSLDCDAIEASVMEAVSAVNHQGIPANHINDLCQWFQAQIPMNQSFYGIYEYNPLYENLSQKGARYLAQLMAKIIH